MLSRSFFLGILFLLANKLCAQEDVGLVIPSDTLTYCNESLPIVGEGFKIEGVETLTEMTVSFSRFDSSIESLLFTKHPSLAFTWNQSTGNLKIEGLASVKTYEKVISDLRYKSKTPTNRDVEISFYFGDADYLPETEHFYKYIAADGISWSEADKQASEMYLFGQLQGYLATITSRSENDFINLKTTGMGWIGCSDRNFNGKDLEGEWRWVTGPEGQTNGGEGLLFWTGGINGRSVNGLYQNWNRINGAMEPNQFNGTNEDWGHILLLDGYKQWNDLPDGGSEGSYYPRGYLVEFGGMPGEPEVNLTATVVIQVKTIEFELVADTAVCYQAQILPLHPAGEYQYQWHLDGEQVSDTTWLAPEVSGEYQLTAVNGACVERATSQVTVHHPKPFLGNDTTLCFPESVLLDATPEFASYQWQSEDETQTFLADTSGIYHVTVSDRYGCYGTDSITVTVYPTPTVQLISDALHCGTKEADISAVLLDAEEAIWDVEGNVTWSSDQPTEVTFSDTTPTSARVTTTSWGDFKLYYTLTTLNGCMIEDSLTVSFYPTPTSSFGKINGESKCKDYQIELKYNGDATAAANYYWDFGGCEVLSELEDQHYAISIGAYNYDPNVSLVVEENGCFSDTTRLRVGAESKFKLWADELRGCDTLTVHFHSELEVDDAVSYLWEFEDGRTSNLQNPVIFIGDTAFFDTKLTVTNTLNGCQNVFAVADMIKVFPTPTTDFSADPDLCYDEEAEIVAIDAIDSTFCHWQLDGLTLLEDKNDTITVQFDEATSTLGLVISEYGCFSAPVEKVLRRKPNADFWTEQTDGCQPFQPILHAISSDKQLNYQWLHDGTFLSGEADEPHDFPDFGLFDAGMIAESDETGCRDTFRKADWILVHPKPEAKFSVDYPVATNEHADITFTNESVGAEKFEWDFDDYQYASAPNPVHHYDDIGEYEPQLIAESAFGCRDTVTAHVQIVFFNSVAPTSFRPQSPIEKNKTFMPIGLGVDETRFELKIFNRWGNLVFTSTHPDEKWNGTLDNGTEAPAGSYVWVTSYFDIQGFPHKQKGLVYLFR